MRVISFNLWFDEYQREERLKSLVVLLISQYPEPDIICFQEVIPSTLILLRNLLEASYPYNVPDELSSAYGQAIFSKHRIIESMSIPFTSRMGRELLITKIDYTQTLIKDNKLSHKKERILVANTHFESEFNKDGKNPLKIEQYQVAEGIINRLLSGCVLGIVCADTNLTPGEESFYFSSGGWKDCWNLVEGRGTDEFTFNSYTNPYHKRFKTKYTARLDRIMYNGDASLTNYSLLEGIEGFLEPSDHYGVMVDIEV